MPVYLLGISSRGAIAVFYEGSRVRRPGPFVRLGMRASKIKVKRVMASPRSWWPRRLSRIHARALAGFVRQHLVARADDQGVPRWIVQLDQGLPKAPAAVRRAHFDPFGREAAINALGSALAVHAERNALRIVLCEPCLSGLDLQNLGAELHSLARPASATGAVNEALHADRGRAFSPIAERPDPHLHAVDTVHPGFLVAMGRPGPSRVVVEAGDVLKPVLDAPLNERDAVVAVAAAGDDRSRTKRPASSHVQQIELEAGHGLQPSARTGNLCIGRGSLQPLIQAAVRCANTPVAVSPLSPCSACWSRRLELIACEFACDMNNRLMPR